MVNESIIKTTKIIYPQIYAYTLPAEEEDTGWIKIGYTERQNVDDRILEQTNTAAIRLKYAKLWSEPAKFNKIEGWFKDKQFHSYLRRYKKVRQRQDTEWFYYDGHPQKSHQDFVDFRNNQKSQIKEQLTYQLRPEQSSAVKQTLDYAHHHPNSEFLWNAKPRFGKTLTTYDLARKLEAQNVLVVTNRPAVANSWFADFEKFIAWQTNYAFVSTNDTLKNQPVLTRQEFNDQLVNGSKKDKMIAFISLQDLKGGASFGGGYDKLKWVKDLHWDLLVIDESHEGVDTFKTDIAFNNINRDFTLNLSGTPFKAVASGEFKQDQIFNWTYADEQQAKASWHDSEKNNPYELLPKLNLFSYQMSHMITNEVNQGAQINGDNIDYAFDLNEFFATNESGHFIHENDIKKWLDTLTQNEKYPFSTKELRNELKHTFWLLNRVASAKALEKLLKEHPVFQDYEIILAAGDGHGLDDDQTINEKSLDRVKRAIQKHDKTITLSVGQLTTGVTIPEWTAVLVLSNLKSPSQYMQAAFRAQNPWEHMFNGQVYQKENAYVFDFAPERTLTIYDEFANDLSKQTSNGNGATKDREKNIRKLLNFFPVIAEDDQGKMVELDVSQILTIPRTIKAQEVVRRGFMSNLLFTNISGIFASAEAREILEQLNPVDVGKTVPRPTEEKINTQDVQLNDHGEAQVDPEIVVATTEAHFGEKIYSDIADAISQASDQTGNLANIAANTFKQEILESAKSIAKENGLTANAAEQVAQQQGNSLAREVQIVQKQTDIKHAQNHLELKKALTESQNNPDEIAQAQTTFENQEQQIQDDYQKEITDKVASKTIELARKTTEVLLNKSEDKKKHIVEDDIRARLRGFARTIPSFLMAYGESTTKLANFDKNIKDDVFKEVTGITLDQFRSLRDTYHFFDETTFDESVQDFLKKKSQLANYFDESQKEDIFDYIPPQKTNQIFTPKWVVKLMLDKFEEEAPNIFEDKDKIFADLYVKSGLYLTEIVKRLYAGLADQIPDPNERLKHILEHQIYGFAPSEIIYNIAKNFVFSPFPKLDSSHLKRLDTLPYAKGEKELDMKFDVVVGNPPYQKSRRNTHNDPLYNFFYDLAEKISSEYILISPARFLFNAGSTDKKWNKKMLSDQHIKVVFYEQDPSKVFPNTDIKGGIAILYRNKNKIFDSIGAFTSFEELNSISNKVSKLTNGTLDQIMSGQGIYKFTPKMHIEHPEVRGILSRTHPNDVGTGVLETLQNILFFKNKPNDHSNYIQILGRFHNKRVLNFIRQDYVNQPFAFDKWKVVLPKANGSGAIGEVLSTPLIGEPLIGFTQTFISIGAFDNKLEAQNALRYVKSKFARTMLGILKITQDNPKDKWSKVPLQDFTRNSDIDWNKSISEIDHQLYKKYGLNQKEINFIETKVKAMD
ncbi:Eco57I restriction-modification methylase domain-containing protein [Oenococcus sicerae]|uniref:Helicase n=1 Tax=Oenococcus sicerae TaxID=2203724 RepID=A0AAJ1R908_9LACO|nr:Eco57I restriction-modification methylase domain-containing protein [Oenococcus sicerae]MDN6900404.1 helicase [Oenococcus sicerae]